VDGDLLNITFGISADNHGIVKTPIACSRLLINEQDFRSSVKSGEITITGKPLDYALEQNYPNPFNPTTTIRYQLPDDAVQAKLTVYNTLGEVVRVLVDEIQNAGTYTIQWDGQDNAGNIVSSGVYYLRLTANGKTNYANVKKMLFMK
jgi:flagellar hook assembly protein FlgD